MSGILFLVRKFCNVEIMPAQRGSPRATSYFHISDNLYIKFDNNDKKGNLGNQWQSLIADIYISISMETFEHRKYKIRGENGNN